MRRLITRMIEDVIAAEPPPRRRARARIPQPTSAAPGAPVIGFSPAMAEADRAIKASSIRGSTATPASCAIMGEAEAVVRGLFAALCRAARPTCRRNGAQGLGPVDAAGRALRIADFIAGMTDRYAMVEHERLVGKTPELR